MVTTSPAHDRGLQRALSRAGRGQALNANELLDLLQARGAHLDALCAIAAGIRDAGLVSAGRPKVITYSRKVFIPLTRMCRDRCHYCTFAAAPAALVKNNEPLFLSIDEVVEIARQGGALGCKEALFTLGDRPQDRWPQAKAWLDERGYDSTLDYLRAAAIAVLEQTGLLPHLNPGVMNWQELHRLRPVSASMGLMLESTSQALFTTPGAVHYGSPDKEPRVRIQTMDDAGRLNIPFTTGLLIGIGESDQDIVDGLFEIRRSAREFGHIREVIIQNFRAKPHTAAAGSQDLSHDAYRAVLAVARLVLGPNMRIQAPPNLSDEHELGALLDAGIDDWGGISPLTPDHVNPERPWPHIDLVTKVCNERGYVLRERLAAHPEHVLNPDAWFDSRIKPFVAALRDSDGLGQQGLTPQGLPWQEPDWVQAGRTDLNTAIDKEGRHAEVRSDFNEAFGDWQTIKQRVREVSVNVSDPILRKALELAAKEPAALAAHANAEFAQALMAATGPALDDVCAIADDLRRQRVGQDVTYVVNRNINFTNVCYTGCRFCAFGQRSTDADAFTLSLDDIQKRVLEAVDFGATEICMQGGIHPDLPGTFYFDLARAVKEVAPHIHLHAFSPMEVVNGAMRANLSIKQWLESARDAGVDSIPGTAAEILDDDVRLILTKGKLPTSQWVDVIKTAHAVGLPSSSTMMYGHVDGPQHRVDHLRLIRTIAQETGGFTEFVPLPFVHRNAPIYLAGIARPGSTQDEDRAVHAMARLMLDGAISNIQVSWVKLDDATVVDLLNSGANDIGGTLMEETISRMAGSDNGSRRTPEQLVSLATRAGRPARQRSTTYA